MHEIEYFASTSIKCLAHFVQNLNRVTNTKSRIVGNKVFFSKNVAIGRFDYYELEPGLSLFIANAKFLTKVRFLRDSVRSNDYNILHFNMSLAPVIVKKDSGNTIDIGSDWNDSVLFTSTAKRIEIAPPLNNHFKCISIVFTKSWISRHIHNTSAPIPISTVYARQLVQDLPMQFTLGLDIRSLNILSRMISDDKLTLLDIMFLHGDALKLIALFIKKITENSYYDENLKFDEVMRIMRFKDNLEKRLDEGLPTLEQCAKECLISKTKFISIFKTIYNKSYSDLFQEMKMQRAAELLREGFPVTVVGHKLGFNNIGYFAKVFYAYFHTTPKQYRKGFFPNLKKSES